MAVGLSGEVLDGLIRSLTKTDDSFLRLADTIDDLSVTFGLWMPDEQPKSEPTPTPGRFCNLDWEDQ